VLGIFRSILWFVTKRSPADLIAPWSGKATAIFILVFICVGLILALIAVVDGARRLYLEAVDDLKKQHGLDLVALQTQLLDTNKRIGIVEVLTNYVTVAQERFDRDPQSRQPLKKEDLEPWLYGAAESIKDWLGHDARKEFFDGADEGEPPPDTLGGQLKWIGKYRGKLRMLIAKQYFEPPDPDPPTMEEEEAKERIKKSVREWVQPKRS
jgi:hypothetical protein